jgi:DNA-binding SARP family transcriptional activator
MGEFQIAFNGRPIENLASRRTSALLSYLAFYRDRSHPREKLIALLWPEAGFDEGRPRLNEALSAIRKQMRNAGAVPERFLSADRHSIRLSDSVETDTGEFAAALQAAEKEADLSVKAELLADACSVYQGELLPGYYEDWIDSERLRLEERFQQALTALSRTSERLGRLDDAAGAARRLFECDPTNERALELLLPLLARQGQLAEASRYYGRYQEALEDIGCPPSEAARELWERARASSVKIAPAPSAPVSVRGDERTDAHETLTEEEYRRAVVLCFGPPKRHLGDLQASSEDEWSRRNEFYAQGERLIAEAGGKVLGNISGRSWAVFGVPAAREDDPRRAAQVALLLREEARKWRTPIAVGLDIGRTSVGSPGSFSSPAAAGPAVASCLSLCDLAAPGELLVSAAFARTVETAYDVRKKTRLDLQTLRPFTVFGVEEASVKGRRDADPLNVPFVGRREELRISESAIRRLKEGLGGILTIVGEAGIGKSRLVLELKHRTGDEAGFRGLWAEAQARERNQTVGFSVMTELLRQFIDLASPGEAGEDSDLRSESGPGDAPTGEAAPLPSLHATFRDLLPLIGFATEDGSAPRLPEQTHRLILESLKSLLLTLAEKEPLVLVVEDLHWADLPSVNALAYLLEVTRTAPVLFCLTARKDKNAPFLRIQNFCAQYYRESWIEVALSPLDSPESEALLGALMETARFEKGKELVAIAAGNPFFLIELARSLPKTGESPYRLGDGAPHALLPSIPETVQNVLWTRFDRLSGAAKRILRMASALGPSFDGQLLAAALRESNPEDEAGDVSAALWDLETSEWLSLARSFPHEEYAFRHALSQQVIYASLTGKDRARLHAKIAQAIESGYKETIEERYGTLAYHYSKTFQKKKTLEYLLKAGYRAKSLYSNREAIDLLEKALPLLASLQSDFPDYPPRNVREDLGRLYFEIGAHQKSEAHFEGALLLTDPGETRRQADLIYRLALSIHWQGDYKRSLRCAQRGLSLARELRDDLLIPRFLEISMRSSWISRDLSSWQAHSEEMASRLLEAPYSEEIFQFHYALAWRDLYFDRYDECMKRLDLMEALALERSSEAGRALCDHGRADLARRREDPETAIDCYRMSLQRTEALNDLHLTIENCLEMSELLILRDGDSAEAWDLIRKALRLSEVMAGERQVANLAEICLGLGITYLSKGFEERATDLYWHALRFGVFRPSEVLCRLECLYIQNRRHEEFLARCREMQNSEEISSKVGLQEWHFSPGSVDGLLFERNAPEEIRSGGLSEDWRVFGVEDEFGSQWLSDGSLLTAHPGQDPALPPLSVPRVVREVEGDFALEVVLRNDSEIPTLGGLTLYFSETDYLVFGKSYRHQNAVQLANCENGDYRIVGRGWLPGEEFHLRIERAGGRVQALCCENGVKWLSCGVVERSIPDRVMTGIYAACPLGYPSSRVHVRSLRFFRKKNLPIPDPDTHVPVNFASHENDRLL